jgi:hypothetical protein
MMTIHTHSRGAGLITALGTILLAGSVLLPLSVRASDEWSPGYQYDMRKLSAHGSVVAEQCPGDV